MTVLITGDVKQKDKSGKVISFQGQRGYLLGGRKPHGYHTIIVNGTILEVKDDQFQSIEK